MTEFGIGLVSPSACQPCDSAEEKSDSSGHWIEIELFHEETGEPVPGEEYVVRLPDGVERRGYLDDAGFAREDGIPSPGQCDISFPQLDRRIWKPV